jgi:hypothetical protein
VGKGALAACPPFHQRDIILVQRLRRHPEVRAVFGAPRRMLFSVVLAAILRGSQELAPQDDVSTSGAVSREGEVVLVAALLFENESKQSIHVVRPPSRGPYGAASRFGSVADAFCTNEGQGLWVPAFAGTTARCGEALCQ